jgi:hypothetical protein
MQSKIYSILFFTLLCIGALYLTSCKPNEQSPCQSASNTNIDFTAAELAKVPYNGFDTLYFLSKTGDTNIVVGGGKQFYYLKTNTTVPPDCPPNQTIQYQAYKINFTPIKGDLNFTFKQQKINSGTIISVKNYLVDFIDEYDFLGTKQSTNIYYIDSVVINLIKYGRVSISLSQINNRIGQYDTTYKLYMNQPNGILYIKSSVDDDEYSIIKK